MIRHVKYVCSNDIHSIDSDYNMLLHPLIRDLKIYFNNRPILENIKYLRQLIGSVRPFFKINTIYSYGELLAYLPLVRKLQMNIDICNRTFLRHQEETVVSICFSRKEKLILTLNVKKDVPHLFLDGIFECTWSSVFDQETGVMEKLVSLFDRFVETHFSPEEIRLIPVFTSEFIRFLLLSFAALRVL